MEYKNNCDNDGEIILSYIYIYIIIIVRALFEMLSSSILKDVDLSET